MDQPVGPLTEQTGEFESEVVVPQTEQADSKEPFTDGTAAGEGHTTVDATLEITQPGGKAPDKVDAMMNTDASTVAEQVTETTRQDLVDAQEKKQNSDDKEFLEREWQKERARRQRYRWNLRERRWQATERCGMFEQDKTSSPRRSLQEQVLEVARRASETASLNLSLPSTPTHMKDLPNLSDDDDPVEPEKKKAKVEKNDENLATGSAPRDKAEADGTMVVSGIISYQELNLPKWLVETFQQFPDDPGRPLARIIRKDSVLRCCHHSRLPPKIHSRVPGPQRPPVGIQILEAYSKPTRCQHQDQMRQQEL